MPVMRHTKMTDAWIAEALRSNPFREIKDPATGQSTGNLQTCPCRGSFVHVMRPTPPMKGQPVDPNKKPKWSTDLLFPPGADLSLLGQAYYAGVRRLFPQHIIRPDGTIFEPYPLHSPFKAQASKLKFDGYTDGGTFITVSTQYKPPIVDVAGNPIVDEARVYPGAWFIAALNTYSYGVNPPQPKKGVGFGLLTLMVVQDDQRTDAGGQADPGKAFAGVVNANFNAPAAFGQPGAFGLPAGGGQLAPGAAYFPVQALPGVAPVPPLEPGIDPRSLE